MSETGFEAGSRVVFSDRKAPTRLPNLVYYTEIEYTVFLNKTIVCRHSDIYIDIMDFISHSLWGGIAFGRRNKRYFLLAIAISLLPDILTEGLFGALYLAGARGIPGWENGHPNITDYPIWAQNLYNFTHSLVVFGVVFLLIWIVARKPLWIICAWGLHILIDIPTHSLALFPTPFLWPISDFKFNGIGWDNALILTADISLLVASYALWWYLKFYKKPPKVQNQINLI